MEKKLKLIEAISENTYGNYPNDIHQCILDWGYKRWQDGLYNGYSDMVEKVQEQLGDFAAYAILFGKYNQQVCNGGHTQFHYNSYTDTFDLLSDLHKKLGMEVFEESIFLKLKDIFQQFENILEYGIDNNRYIEEEYYDEDSEEYITEEYPNDNYGTFINMDILNNLDDDYYKIADIAMEQFESFCKEDLI